MHGLFSYPLYGGVYMKSVIIVSYSIIAALIGAGFASGQEILCYFVRFNRFGFVAIVLSALLFSVFVYIVLSYCIRHKIDSYDSFMSVFGNKYMRFAAKTVTLTFSLAVYGAMLSACGVLLFELFGIEKNIGSLAFAIICTIAFSLGTDKVFTFNAALGITLVFLMTFSCLYILSYREFHVFAQQLTEATQSGMIYSGYNLVSLSPVLVALAKRLKSRNDAISTALSVGMASYIVMLLIYILLSIYYERIPLGELPMLTLARRQNPAFAVFYSFILFSAIITTLLSSGGGLCDALNARKNPIFISIISATAYLISSVGFSQLINTAYRFSGILGFFVCMVIAIQCVRKQ